MSHAPIVAGPKLACLAAQRAFSATASCAGKAARLPEAMPR